MGNSSLRLFLKTLRLNRVYWKLREFKTQQQWRQYRQSGLAQIQQYMTTCRQENHPFCVQIGCGGKTLLGWLNTEYAYYPNCVFLDMTQPLPFATGEVEFIVAEHVLANVPKWDGGSFLRECHRCLKPGGILRLSTPNLTALSRLIVGDDLVGLAQALTARHSRLYRQNQPVSVCDLVNDIHYLWDHRYLYSEEELLAQLHAAGFTQIERVRFGESRDSRLINIDKHQAGPEMAYIDLRVEAVR